MPMPKIADARALTDEELANEIVAVKKELFELRLRKATRQLEQPHLLRMAKHRLAQLMTVEGERKRGIHYSRSESTSDSVSAGANDTSTESPESKEA